MVNLKDLDGLLKIPCYKRYYKKKQSLKEKFPQYKEYGTTDYRNYISGMGELLTKDKDWQDFIWYLIPEHDRQIQERLSRPSKVTFESYSI